MTIVEFLAEIGHGVQVDRLFIDVAVDTATSIVNDAVLTKRNPVTNLQVAIGIRASPQQRFIRQPRNERIDIRHQVLTREHD